MKEITILPGCITCGLCGTLAPDVFEVTDIARVKSQQSVATCMVSVQKAIDECPVQVIQFSSKKDDISS